MDDLQKKYEEAQALIRKQQKQLEESQKKISELLPGADKLNDVLNTFTSSAGPGIVGIEKTAEQLQKVANDLAPLLKTLSSLDKETLEKIKKA